MCLLITQNLHSVRWHCDKKNHFARDCRSKNKKNRRQINVLIKVSDKTETQKKKLKINILKLSTDDEYYRIENVNKLKKVLNHTALDKAFASTQKINNAIWRTFNRLKISFSYKNRSKLNDEYKWSKEFREQLREFEKKFIKKLKLTDLETIEIIKEIFVKRDVESNTFIFKFINEKLTWINWKHMFILQHMRTDRSRNHELYWCEKSDISNLSKRARLSKSEMYCMNQEIMKEHQCVKCCSKCDL